MMNHLVIICQHLIAYGGGVAIFIHNFTYNVLLKGDRLELILYQLAVFIRESVSLCRMASMSG